MNDALQRLYKAKLTILGLIFLVVGIALLLVDHLVNPADAGWLVLIPLGELGSALFTAGLVGLALHYLDSKDAEVRAMHRLKTALHEEAPALRDAVVDGFAFAPDALVNVASPEKLDAIIDNCLAIRLGDPKMAADVAHDLREQVRARERWRDVHVSVSLSPWEGAQSADMGPLFVATVRWEYRVVPSTPTLRFACVSDPEEYRELLKDSASTVAWHFPAVGTLDAGSREVFEVVQCSVNGKARPIRHAKRKGSQVYTVASGNPEAEPHEVQLSYTYKVLVEQNGNLLYLDIAKPAHGLKVEFWPGADTGIRHVNVLDFIAGAKQPTILRTPPSVPTPNISVSYDGWVFPKSGVAFVWVHEGQVTRSSSRYKA